MIIPPNEHTKFFLIVLLMRLKANFFRNSVHYVQKTQQTTYIRYSNNRPKHLRGQTDSEYQNSLPCDSNRSATIYRSATTVVRQGILVLPIHLTYQALWPSGLGNDFICKRFTVQILLRSLGFVIKKNLEDNATAV